RCCANTISSSACARSATSWTTWPRRRAPATRSYLENPNDVGELPRGRRDRGGNGFTRRHEDTETKRSRGRRVRPARSAGGDPQESRASTNPLVPQFVFARDSC